MKTRFKIISIESNYPTRARIHGEKKGDSQVVDRGDVQGSINLIKKDISRQKTRMAEQTRAGQMAFALQDYINNLAILTNKELKRLDELAKQEKPIDQKYAEYKKFTLPRDYQKKVEQLIKGAQSEGMYLPISVPAVHADAKVSRNYNRESIKNFQTRIAEDIQKINQRVRELARSIKILEGK